MRGRLGIKEPKTEPLSQLVGNDGDSTVPETFTPAVLLTLALSVFRNTEPPVEAARWPGPAGNARPLLSIFALQTQPVYGFIFHC